MNPSTTSMEVMEKMLKAVQASERRCEQLSELVSQRMLATPMNTHDTSHHKPPLQSPPRPSTSMAHT